MVQNVSLNLYSRYKGTINTRLHPRWPSPAAHTALAACSEFIQPLIEANRASSTSSPSRQGTVTHSPLAHMLHWRHPLTLEYGHGIAARLLPACPAALCLSLGYNTPSNRMTGKEDKSLLLTAKKLTACHRKQQDTHNPIDFFHSFLFPCNTCGSERVIGKFYVLSSSTIKSSQVLSS